MKNENLNNSNKDDILDFNLENIENRISLNKFILENCLFNNKKIEIMTFYDFIVFLNEINEIKTKERDKFSEETCKDFNFNLINCELVEICFLNFNNNLFVLMTRKFKNDEKLFSYYSNIFNFFKKIDDNYFLFKDSNVKNEFFNQLRDFIQEKTICEINVLYNVYRYSDFMIGEFVKKIEEKICQNIPDFFILMEYFDLVKYFSHFFKNNIFSENNNKQLIENRFLKQNKYKYFETNNSEKNDSEINDSETNDSKTELFHQINQIKE